MYICIYIVYVCILYILYNYHIIIYIMHIYIYIYIQDVGKDNENILLLKLYLKVKT